MCAVCRDDRCSGRYLLHPKELSDRCSIIRKELLENKNKKFILVKSPSSGEMFTQFYELHVIDNVTEAEAGKLIDRRCNREYSVDMNNLTDMTEEQIKQATDLAVCTADDIEVVMQNM